MTHLCIGIPAVPGHEDFALTALIAEAGAGADIRPLPPGGMLGTAALFNRLVGGTAADVYILLDAGVRLGPGWLNHVLAGLGTDPRNGIAGPSTNRGWNEQCVFPGAGGTPAEIVRTAAEAERRFGSEVRTLEPLHSLSDFCYAVRREVVDTIGAADEGYSGGPCWEMDYNIRAARAGFRAVWACAAYVWRPPPSPQHLALEARYLEASRRRYQDHFCGLRLRGEAIGYEPHCRGEDCPHFAPKDLIRITRPLHRPTAPAPKDPLVSCIMPTRDRRPFVGQAIDCFLRQDYPNCELVILDDGTDTIRDLVPDDARIRYVALAARLPLGAKRNLACKEARGEIIVHWDDDDWHAPWRVGYQVRHLLERRADLCGVDRLLFYDPGTDRSWRYIGPPGGLRWVAGGTFCYTRSCWERIRFTPVDIGEDARFVMRVPREKVAVLPDDSFYLALIHAGNTCPKRTSGSLWHACPSQSVRDRLGEDFGRLRKINEAVPSGQSEHHLGT